MAATNLVERGFRKQKSAEAFSFHLFPEIFVFVLELAGQGVDRDIVLSTELPPQDESQVELTR